jgi:hypothetical protein
MEADSLKGIKEQSIHPYRCSAHGSSLSDTRARARYSCSTDPGPCASDCNAVFDLPFHAVPVPLITFGKPDGSINPLPRTCYRKFIAPLILGLCK